MATQRSGNIRSTDRTVGWLASTTCAILMFACGRPASAVTAWPTIPLPEGVESIDMGSELIANGLPLRMRGILSNSSPDWVASQLRKRLGQPLVEQVQGKKLVLGRTLGDFYVTVQLEPAGAGTRGLIAISNPLAAIKAHDATRETETRTLSRFPIGSQLIGRTISMDGPHRSEFIALRNSFDVDLNIEQLKNSLRAEGYSLERAASGQGFSKTAAAQGRLVGTTLFFRRPGSEAVAVVYRDGAGNTATVLNTVTDMGK